MIRPFDQLSKAGQTRRLRALASEALVAFGLPSAHVRLLHDSFNTVFRVQSAEGSFVLRVHRPDARGATGLQAELAWLLALRATPGAPQVPEPMATPVGTYLVEVRHPGVPTPRICNLFRWTPGRLLEDALRPERVSQLGGIARFFHEHTRTAHAFDAPRGDTLYGVEPDVLLAAPLPPRLRGQIDEARARCDVLYARYDATPRQLCHMDLHPGNVLLTRAGLAVLDFDDCGVTWPALDLGILAFYLQTEPDPARAAELIAAAADGYGPGFPPADDLRGFILGRQLSLLNSLLQDPDPGMKALLPDYLVKVEGRLDRWLA